MVRNIVLAIFACVIFFGSCMLCTTDVGPVVGENMPLLSAVGFLFSIALGIYSIKKMK